MLIPGNLPACEPAGDSSVRESELSFSNCSILPLFLSPYHAPIPSLIAFLSAIRIPLQPLENVTPQAMDFPYLAELLWTEVDNFSGT